MNENENTLWRDEWIPVSEAAKEVGVRAGKISSLIKDGALQTRQNPIDKRQVLVERKAVYELFRRKLNQ